MVDLVIHIVQHSYVYTNRGKFQNVVGCTLCHHVVFRVSDSIPILSLRLFALYKN